MAELLDLSCPRCSAPLPTAAHRRVFVCSGCHETYLPRFGSTKPRLQPIQRDLLLPARELPERGAIVLLPVWRLPVPADAGLPLPAEIRVPAVGMGRMQLLVNLAVHLTRCQISPRVADASTVPREPAQLAPEDAFGVAELVAMGVVPGWPADDDIEAVEIPFGTPKLVDVPCQLDGLQLVDLVFGRSVSASVLDEQSFEDRRRLIEESLSKTMS